MILDLMWKYDLWPFWEGFGADFECPWQCHEIYRNQAQTK
jgi:hypothetical protein